MKIAISKIIPDPNQPRKAFDATALNELANSISARGLIQQITVRAIGRGRFMIVAGERRWRAHELLRTRGIKRFAFIDANVVKASAAAARMLAQIVENIQRAEMTPLEEAAAFKSLVDTGMTAAEIATELGLATFRVEWRLQLLNLAPEPRKLFECGHLDRQQALEIARLPTEAEQRRVVQLINRGELVGWKSVRSAVDVIAEGKTQADIFGDLAPKPKAEHVATLSAMERRIETVKAMVGAGWKNGECIVAARVNLDRAGLMADQLSQIQKALRVMESELRNVSAQGRVALVTSPKLQPAT